MTVQVVIHAYSSNQRVSDREYELTRIPSVGEYITIPDDGRWFKVEVVVHWIGLDLDGEIYALAFEPQDVINTSGFMAWA